MAVEALNIKYFLVNAYSLIDVTCLNVEEGRLITKSSQNCIRGRLCCFELKKCFQRQVFVFIEIEE